MSDTRGMTAPAENHLCPFLPPLPPPSGSRPPFSVLDNYGHILVGLSGSSLDPFQATPHNLLEREFLESRSELLSFFCLKSFWVSRVVLDTIPTTHHVLQDLSPPGSCPSPSSPFFKLQPHSDLHMPPMDFPTPGPLHLPFPPPETLFLPLFA